MTQLEMMASTVASATGRCSISPSRNSTLRQPPLTALARALEIISGVMSTPMTRPVGPDLACGEEGVEAGAAAEVEHGLARLQRCDGLRVAAAQAEVGAFRHGGGLLGAVADALRQQFGDGLVGRRAASRARRAAAAGGFGTGNGAVGGADLLADFVVFFDAHVGLL